MIVIAQCTHRKRDGEWRAEELYMKSALFQAQRRYWEAYAESAYILSGKYGLIQPWRIINSYDQHISDQDSEEWQLQVQQRVKTIAKHNERIEIIAGKEKYGRRLEPYLEMQDINYSYPFEGLGIGERTKQMKQEARKVENNQLTNYAP